MAVTGTPSQQTLTSTRFGNPPWWNRRSRLERILCAVASLSLMLCTAMVVALAIVGYRYRMSQQRLGFPTEEYERLDRFYYSTVKENEHLQKPSICLTQGCVKAAASILSNINEKVDPCDDFYQFACGGWLQKQIIPDDKSSVSVFSLLQDELDLKLRYMVENDIKDTDPLYIRNMKNMYNACMNTTHIEKQGNEPLVRALKELGGWPVVEGSNWTQNNSFDWMKAVFNLRKQGFGYSIFLSLSIGPDIRNNTRHVIDLDQASLGMPDRSYLLKGLDDVAVAAYYKLMTDSAVLLGANRTAAEIEMKETLEFEIQLANISVPREERRNISRLYNKMTVDDLYKLAPNINWDSYMNNLLTDVIGRSEEIIVIAPDFVQRVEKLLSSTNRRILANYLIWRVVGQAFSMLGRAWGEISQHYSSILTGKIRQESRWEHCLGTLSGSLSTALASLYVQHHFKQESKDQASQMVNYIHREFLKIVDGVEWMDNETRNRAKDKARSMATYIGYPNELLESKKVAEIYEGLSLNPFDYFQNVQHLRKWATDYVFSKLRKPNEKGDWKKRSAAAVVNAYYNSIENSIEFPAGILQGAFFNKDRPNYLNFGAIGFVIGHEITHGFDDRGRQFDKDGNNVNWWEDETDNNYRERAQCIIDQYGNYTVAEVGIQVNGINTQGENIADNGGIKESFRAYQQWAMEHGKEEPLPGLKYTPNQLFWISAANVWCGKYRPEVLKLRILTGSHSPAPFRVIGPMSNSEEFSAVFGCALGSPMNPEKKCSVW